MMELGSERVGGHMVQSGDGSYADGDSKWYRCRHPGCDRVYPRKYSLELHQRVHSSAQLFWCSEPNCSRKFKWRSSLLSHMASHRRNGQQRMPGRLGELEPQNTRPASEPASPGYERNLSSNETDSTTPALPPHPEDDKEKTTAPEETSPPTQKRTIVAGSPFTAAGELFVDDDFPLGLPL